MFARLSCARKEVTVSSHLRPVRFTRSIAFPFLAAALVLSGCISSRSLIEDLAKTPHHPVQESERYAALNHYQQDLLYLTEMVRESHPEPYAAWTNTDFDAEQLRLLQTLTNDTSKVVFERAIGTFLSRLNDSHTGASVASASGKSQYPVSFFWIKDTLLLASVDRQADTSLIGSHVLSFNGVPTDEVFRRFRGFIGVDNVYRARRVLQYYFVFPAYHREAHVTHSDTLDLQLLTRSGTRQLHRILPTEDPKRIAPYRSNPITEKVNRPFVYEILKDERACYLQYNTMIDLRFKRFLSFPMSILAHPVAWFYGVGYFEDFLMEMFEEMGDEGVQTLIVDLRNNGGGSSVYGEQLLYYLDVPSNIRTFSMAVRFSPFYRAFSPEAYDYYDSCYAKKYHGAKLPDSLILTSDFAQQDSLEDTYFRNVTDPSSEYHIAPSRKIFQGNVYFLVGEGTFSSAIILSTLVKDNKLFTVVGQPTQGRPSHYGETLVLKLPNSGIVARISCKKFFRPDGTRDSEDALYPDVEIWPTVDDLRHGRDPVFEWVLDDARHKTSITK